MIRRIVVANQKGGVAKTTTVNSLGAGLGLRGYKVLLVDLDPQENLTESVGLNDDESNTVYELLKNEVQAKDILKKYKYFDLIPGDLRLASADMEFTQIGKEQLLKENLQELEKEYDFVLVDTPPTLGILTANGLTYADEVIVPIDIGVFAFKGILQLYRTIQSAKKYCNPSLKIAGLLLTKFDERTVISTHIKDTVEEIAEKMETIVFETKIRGSVALGESQINEVDIFTYDSKNNVAIDYNNLIDEYLEKIGKINDDIVRDKDE